MPNGLKVEKRAGYNWTVYFVAADDPKDQEPLSGSIFGTGAQITMDQAYVDLALDKENFDIILLVREDHDYLLR